MAIGGSWLWIGGCGVSWPMMLMLVSIFFLTPGKGFMRLRERDDLSKHVGQISCCGK